jgi:hypothetical protein
VAPGASANLQAERVAPQDAEQKTVAPQATLKARVADPLERELERIARLRSEGKQDEADAALATFRREHPDYRIEPAMWERVRRP